MTCFALTSNPPSNFSAQPICQQQRCQNAVFAAEEPYSLYGLSRYLSEIGDLLDRADQASVSKAPKAQDDDSSKSKCRGCSASRFVHY